MNPIEIVNLYGALLHFNLIEEAKLIRPIISQVVGDIAKGANDNEVKETV